MSLLSGRKPGPQSMNIHEIVITKYETSVRLKESNYFIYVSYVLAYEFKIHVVNVLFFVHPEFLFLVLNHYFFVCFALVLDNLAALVNRVTAGAGTCVALWAQLASALVLQHDLVLLEER